MTTIAFIGFGEAAQSIAGGLNGRAGLRLTAFDLRFADPAAADTLARAAAERGVTPLENISGIASADLVMSLVVGAATRNVAASAAPHLSDHAVYIDLNSVGPETKALAAAEIAQGRGSFVEGAVMARVPPYAEKVPILVLRGVYLGGSGEKVDAPRVAGLLGLFAAAAVSSGWIGLPISLAFGTGVATLLFPGQRPLLRAVLTGAGFWAIAYFLFGKLLGLPLP